MSTFTRPFIAVNIAMTADGKIAPVNRRFRPFGSKRDQDHMMELRAGMDAVMTGATTVANGKVTLGPGGKKYQRQRLEKGLAEFNLRIVVSRTASMSPRAHIFTKRFSPVIVLTTEAAPHPKLKALAAVADELHVTPGEQIDFPAVLRWFREKWNVKKLLCEGGGELNAPLFRLGLVDELHLTICPLIFGGRKAPTLADGEGIEHLVEAKRFRLKRQQRFGDELFCVFARE
ncbi:MAG TPA: dihydrofolate reductase family protein [Verrucomicrobiae bacterium]